MKIWKARFPIARDNYKRLLYTMMSNIRGFSIVMTEVDMQRIKFQGRVSDLFYVPFFTVGELTPR